MAFRADGFAVSVRGASHIADGRVCQDASAFHLAGESGLVAVSDGHGSAKHFRSDIGARIACDCALGAAEAFLRAEDAWLPRAAREADALLRQLERNILWRWTRACAEHLARNPLSSDERAVQIKEKLPDAKLLRAYGATLLLGVLSARYAIGVQIGDGSFLCFRMNGDADDMVPYDTRQGMSVTNSLCLPTALADFRHAFLPERVAALVLCTDGVTDSFRRDNRVGFSRWVATRAHDDREAARAYLEGYLPEVSSAGSRDDMSLGCVFSVDAFMQERALERAGGAGGE